MCDHAELVAEMGIVEQLPAQDRLKHAHHRRLRQVQLWTDYDQLISASPPNPTELKRVQESLVVEEVEEREGDKQGGNYYYYCCDEPKEELKRSPSSPHYPDIVSSALSCLANEKKDRKERKSRGKKKNGVKFVPGIVLLEAASRNDLNEVRNLLENGIDPNVCNADGLTALHQCCIDDYYEMVELLLEYEANINAFDTELWTPLHAAATCGHANLIKLFADKGADLLALNADGNMPYDMCEDELALDVLEAEMSNRGITQEDIDTARSQPEKEMLIDVKKLADKGSDLLENRDYRGATPLHIASANGFTSVVDFLLDQKVLIDGQDNDLWTPLHGAAYWGHPMVIESLIGRGADIDAKNKDGETPIDICEDPDIKERLMDIKTELEQSKLLQPMWLHPNSRTSTRRSSSIRRSSIRDKSALSRREMVEEAKMRQGTNQLSSPSQQVSPRKSKLRHGQGGTPNANHGGTSADDPTFDGPVPKVESRKSLPSILIQNVADDSQADNCLDEFSLSPQITRVEDSRMIVPLKHIKSEKEKMPISPDVSLRSDDNSPPPPPTSYPFQDGARLSLPARPFKILTPRGESFEGLTHSPIPPSRSTPTKPKASLSTGWAALKTLRHIGLKMHPNLGNKGLDITQRAPKNVENLATATTPTSGSGLKNAISASEKCLLPELKRIRKLHNDHKLLNRFGKVSDKTSPLCASTSSLTPLGPLADRKLDLGRSLPSLNTSPNFSPASRVAEISPKPNYNSLSLSVRTVGRKRSDQIANGGSRSPDPSGGAEISKIENTDVVVNMVAKGSLVSGKYTGHGEKFRVDRRECCSIA